MPEKATVEFWRDIPAIEKSKVFKPDALPEAYIHDAPTRDERYFVPITDTVSSRPLWISPQRNQWCDILMAKRAGLVNRHYHPHEVFAYTISGKWGYLEHDWTTTAGDFVYETPARDIRWAYEHADPMRVFFNVKGPRSGWTRRVASLGVFDVHDYIAMSRAHYEKVGLGAAAIDKLFR